MDKAEYQEKLEELTGYMNDRDYESALALANEIDWKRVKSIRTLNMVADVYEKNREYEDARRILLMALGRASVGRTILARLVEVSIKLGEIEDAEKYYDQFSKAAGNDNSRYVLQYKMFKAKRAPLEAQIAVLEEYRDREYTEKWAYELASLYAKAGDPERCVAACDDLILWFGGGKYVLKALDLKMKYDTLTASQRQLYEEEKAKAEQEAVMSVRKAATVNQTDAQMKDKIAESFQDVFSGIRRPQQKPEDTEAAAVENTVPLDQLHISELEPEHSDAQEVTAEASAAETIVSVPKKKRGRLFRRGFKKEEKQEEKVWQDIGINKKKEDEEKPLDLDSLLQETAGEFSREISAMGDAPELEQESELEGGTPQPVQPGSAGQAGETETAAQQETASEEQTPGETGTAGEAAGGPAEDAVEAGSGQQVPDSAEVKDTEAESDAGRVIPGAPESGFFREAAPDEAVYQTGMLTAELPDILSVKGKEEESAEETAAEPEEPKEKKPSFWARFKKGMKKLAAPGPDADEELGEPVGEPPVVGQESAEPSEDAAAGEPSAAAEERVAEPEETAVPAAEENTTEHAAAAEPAEAAAIIAGEKAAVAAEAAEAPAETTAAPAEAAKAPAETAAEAAEASAETAAEVEESSIVAAAEAALAEAEEAKAAKAEKPDDAAAQKDAGAAAEESGPAAALRRALEHAASLSAAKNAEKAEQQSKADAEFAAAAREAGASVPGIVPPVIEAAAAEAKMPEDGGIRAGAEMDALDASRAAAEAIPEEKPRRSAFRDSIRAAVENAEKARKAEIEEEMRKAAEEAERIEAEAAAKKEAEEAAAREEAARAEEEARKAAEDAEKAKQSEAEREALEIEKARKAAAKRAERMAAREKEAAERAAAEAEKEAAERAAAEEEKAAEAEKEAAPESAAEAEKGAAPEAAAEEKTADAGSGADKASETAPGENAGRKALYNEELEVPDPETDDRLSHSRTLDLSKVGENTVPVSLDEIIMSETPEERRIRFLHNESSLRMNDEQRKIFTYFARVPGMDNQILSALSAVYQHADEHTSSHGNIAVIGALGSGKSRLARAMISAMCLDLGMEAAKIARLSGFQMNKKDPAKVVDKMSGGFLIIEECSEMNEETVEKLGQAMDFRTDRMILILEDEKAAYRGFQRKYPEFAAKIDKTISIPIFTNDELITFARTYAAENGYTLDDMAILALYTIIGNNQSYEQPMTISRVKTLLDQAMNNSKKAPKRKKGRKGRGKDADLIVLQEKDFEAN